MPEPTRPADDEQRTVVSPELFDELAAGLEQPPEPNENLRRAFDRARAVVRRAELVWEYGIFDPVGHEPMAVVHSDAEVRAWLADRRIPPGSVRVERRKVSDWSPAPAWPR